MVTKAFSPFFNNSFFKNLNGMDSYPVNIGELYEAQLRNVQAISKAQQCAMEGLQAAMAKQGAIISEIVQNQTEMAQEMLNENAPEKKIVRQTELAQKNYEKSIKNMKALADLLNRSGQDASNVINERITDSLSEIRDLIDNSSKKAA